MNSSTAATMPHGPPPSPELYCAGPLWEQLILSLRERGHHGKRESGAFLLGQRIDGRARIAEFILYDDLDPHSLDRGIVHFDGRYYGALWDRCRRTGRIVVADVHTHPYGARQSSSDRAHPMIATAGHIALIIPDFALQPPPLRTIGMYRYLGAQRWYTVPRAQRGAFLQIEPRGVSA